MALPHPEKKPAEYLTGAFPEPWYYCIFLSMVYLDWAATAAPYPEIAAEAASLSCRIFGNPSSMHSAGKEAKIMLETSREKLAGCIGADKGQIIFTSGGSEADKLVMQSTLRGKSRKTVIISAIEHDAIDREAKTLEDFGFAIERIKPKKSGIIDAGELADRLSKDTALVSVMAVNNETGAIQPVQDILKIIHAFEQENGRAPFFHCDAVQAHGSIGLRLSSLGMDSAAFSAHKLGGPKGIGALYVKKRIEPLTSGGQEGGMRAGTENPAAAWAFAEVMKKNTDNADLLDKQAKLLESRLLEGIKSIIGAVVIPENRSAGDPRYCPNIICLSFPGLGSETLVRLLDESGIAVSAGAACSSAKKERRVLDAMGTDRVLSFSAIRLSTGWNSSIEDIDKFLETAASIYKRYKV